MQPRACACLVALYSPAVTWRSVSYCVSMTWSARARASSSARGPQSAPLQVGTPVSVDSDDDDDDDEGR